MPTKKIAKKTAEVLAPAKKKVVAPKKSKKASYSPEKQPSKAKSRKALDADNLWLEHLVLLQAELQLYPVPGQKEIYSKEQARNQGNKLYWELTHATQVLEDCAARGETDPEILAQVETLHASGSIKCRKLFREFDFRQCLPTPKPSVPVKKASKKK